MIDINNKMLISLGGVVVLVPAKPIIALAAIGAISICAVSYYLYDVNKE